MLGKLSPLGVVGLVDKWRFDKLSERLLQHAEDLDYVQSFLTLVAGRPDINQPMIAACDAFNRRRLTFRFKQGNQNVESDALLNETTKTSRDDDSVIHIKAATSSKVD